MRQHVIESRFAEALRQPKAVRFALKNSRTLCPALPVSSRTAALVTASCPRLPATSNETKSCAMGNGRPAPRRFWVAVSGLTATYSTGLPVASLTIAASSA